jgi:predicted MFS family arabinose efflux permease
MAISAGVAVANLYWAQPLLALIAQDFGVTTRDAGLLIFATQIGYAVGIFFLVPLGDSLDRRRLITTVMLCSAVALAASIAAPGFRVLLATLATVGATTVAGQLLIPLAGDLTPGRERGSAVGMVVSGILGGISLCRPISGAIADVFGWRAVYAFALFITLLVTVLLFRALPDLPARSSVPYFQLLSSVFSTVRASRTAQVTLIVGASGVAVFMLYWTGLTFLLSAPPYSYSAMQIGLLGIVGLAGALAAKRAGWIHDRGWSIPATEAALVLALVSLGIAVFVSTSLILVVTSVLLIDVALQAMNVLNQTRLLAIDATARSRFNTAFVTANFLGGATGSMFSVLLWQSGGWPLVCLGGFVVIAFALVVWLSQRGHLLASITRSNADID